MITTLLPRPLRCALLALIGAAALAAPAHAAFVQGDWDPPFGEPFPQLGWRGTATILVPTDCLDESGPVLNNGSVCSSISVVNAEVEFYDVDVPAVTVETLDFDNKVAVHSIFVTAGQVQGFSLTPTGRAMSTSPLAITPPPEVQAGFELELDFITGSDTIAVLNWYGIRDLITGSNDPNFPAHVVITQFNNPVSLPGTAGLALGALALLAAARRRS